jgi:FlaA1/EpsC-like NDP-sugar epimerase
LPIIGNRQSYITLLDCITHKQPRHQYRTLFKEKKEEKRTNIAIMRNTMDRTNTSTNEHGHGQDASYTGKVVFVTGAGSGIGRATALAFAREGASVVVADVSEQDNQETARIIEEAGGRSPSCVT